MGGHAKAAITTCIGCTLGGRHAVSKKATGSAKDLRQAKPPWHGSLSAPLLSCKQGTTGRQLRYARPSSPPRSRAAEPGAAACMSAGQATPGALGGGRAPAAALSSFDEDDWQPPGAWHYDHVCGTWHRGLRVAFDRPRRRQTVGTSTYAPSRPQLAQLGDSLQGAVDSLRRSTTPDVHSSALPSASPLPPKGPEASHRPAPRPQSARSHRNARAQPRPMRPHSASHRSPRHSESAST